MNKNLAITAVLGVLSVVLGAFGAHALKEVLTVQAIQSYHTAIQYMMFHVIVLLVVNTSQWFSQKLKNRFTVVFVVAMLCFSGSIFAITIFEVNPKSIWFVTPLGGLLFVFGWIYLLIEALKKKL